MIREGVQPLDVVRVQKMAEAIKGESQRGIVLITATLLDEMLRQSIESHLVGHEDVKKLIQKGDPPPLAGWQ